MPLNERDRIEILMMIGVGDRMRTQQEVCRLFHEMHPDREPVSQSTVSRIERKYRELGHVRDAPRQGRPKINENVQQDVILSALENPHCTVRQVSRDLNIGKSSVSNIFKKVKYHPYRVRLIHELAEDDFDRRTEFCEYMMDHNNQNNGFIANILFSDEATFFVNGHVNRQNTRYWSQENPHWMQEYHTQHPQKVNVWAGIVRNRIDFYLNEETMHSMDVDIVEVTYLKENPGAATLSDPICRLCLKRNRCVDLYVLNESFGEDITAKCVPEIDIDFARDPKICLSCQTTLVNFYRFVTKCSVKQENIMECDDREACLAIKSEELDIKMEEEECDR
ncbi:hypothetical protein NQ318_000230 [Aromia moschata]|uniref:ZAD domain-containing protein n=1 Tax=Aromia moschata TaxID=1265417 RepID=A0AAV8X9W5_9CUCU|nr:hypothetical protein NQ318_000230 [Aromia moschata]